jgi:PAS domain S-box-containing protein
MGGIDIDISARKLAELSLVEAEKKYSDFYDHAPDLLFSVDAETARILECNQTACRELGYEKSELVGKPVFQIYAPESQDKARESFEKFAQAGAISNVELQLQRKDGSALDVSLSASAVRDGDQIVRSRSICRVTTDLKKATASLQRSEAESRARAQELEAILGAVPAMTFIAHDPECKSMTSSRAAYELLRLPAGANSYKSALEGARPSNFRFLRDGQEIPVADLPVQQAAATGREVRNTELTIAFDDGTRCDIFGHAVPLLDECGSVRGAVGAFVDITEQKRLEQLRLAETTQRNILEREILAREGERRRLARELHDEAGQTLASLLAGLGVLESSKDLRGAKMRARHLRRLTAHGIDEISRISHGLHPLALDDFGLKVALQHLVKDHSQLPRMKITSKITGLGSRRLPQIVEIKVYRIAQEALNNARKHANAKSIHLTLEATSNRLNLKIIDDGKGFHPKQVMYSNSRMGLQSMQERASMIGGEFTVDSGKNGTTVCLNLLLSNEKLRGNNWAEFQTKD